MQTTITLKKEHWKAFVELIEDIYAKDNPCKYALANAIRDAVEASKADTADVVLDYDEYEQAVEISKDIKDEYYGICHGSEHVAVALGVNKKPNIVRGRFPNIIAMPFTANETGIVCGVCKDFLIATDDEESIMYEAADSLNFTLDKLDIGEDYDAHTHIFILEALTAIFQIRIDNGDMPRKKLIIMKTVQRRLLTIFCNHNKSIPKTQLRKQMQMSENEKIQLSAAEWDEYVAQLHNP